MEGREKQIEEMFNDIVEIAGPYYYDSKGHAHIDFADLDKLAEKFNNLALGYDWEDYIELYEVKADGTLVFETNRMSYIGG